MASRCLVGGGEFGGDAFEGGDELGTADGVEVAFEVDFVADAGSDAQAVAAVGLGAVESEGLVGVASPVGGGFGGLFERQGGGGVAEGVFAAVGEQVGAFGGVAGGEQSGVIGRHGCVFHRFGGVGKLA